MWSSLQDFNLLSPRSPPMMTSSNGNIFRITDPLSGEFTGPGEFPAQRPVTQSFDVFFDLRPNKRLSKQPWGWWFETLSWSLWRQCNASDMRWSIKIALQGLITSTIDSDSEIWIHTPSTLCLSVASHQTAIALIPLRVFEMISKK